MGGCSVASWFSHEGIQAEQLATPKAKTRVFSILKTRFLYAFDWNHWCKEMLQQRLTPDQVRSDLKKEGCLFLWPHWQFRDSVDFTASDVNVTLHWLFFTRSCSLYFLHSPTLMFFSAGDVLIVHLLLAHTCPSCKTHHVHFVFLCLCSHLVLIWKKATIPCWTPMPNLQMELEHIRPVRGRLHRQYDVNTHM